MRLNNRHQSLLFGLLTLLLAVAGGTAVMVADYRLAYGRFNDHASRFGQQLRQRLLTTEGVITGLVNLRDSTDWDGLGQTGTTLELTRSYPYISGIARLDRVVFTDLQEYERRLRDAGQPSFEVKELNRDKPGFRKARVRNQYLVVSRIVPLQPGTAQFLGLDMLVNPEVSVAIKRAMQAGGAVLVRTPAKLWGDDGLLMLRSTYYGRVAPRTLEERMQQASGAVMLSLDTARMFEPLLIQFPDVDFRLELHSLDQDAGSDTLLTHLHRHDSRRLSLPLDFTRQQELELLNRRLSLTASSHYHPTPVMLAIAAIVMLLIAVAAWVWRQARHHRETAISQVETATNAIYHERERAEVTLRSIDDAVITTDQGGNVTYMNPVAEKLLGLPGYLAQGKLVRTMLRLIDEDSDELVDDPLKSCTQNNPDGSRPARLLQLPDDRGRVAVDVSCSELKDVRGGRLGSVIVIRDTSRERALQQQLAYQANHDPLTGLCNRVMFEAEIRQAIETCEDGIGHALCYMDLDQFKVVNDTCGHIAGDALLKQLAHVLENRVRDSDVLARLGGDEFGLLLLNCDLDNAMGIADSLRLAIKQFIFRWEGQAFDIRMSIGVVAINDAKRSYAELMSAADVACYIAKDSGRDIIHAYQPEDLSVTEHHDQMQWSQKIQNALREDRFYLMLQTMAPLLPSQQSVQIQEFLLRIRQADGSIVTPDVFIPAAERYGLMKYIDAWVIDHALQVISGVQQESEQAITYIYSVNVSGQSLGDPEFAATLLSKLEEHGVNASQLMLEITETAAIANFTIALDFIEKLSNAGCRFALDDFGAGLSSFGYLKQLHIDFLKIDGQFVKGMARDAIDRMMVNNITHLGYGLGLYVIAESVEDEETMKLLREIGVHFAQGYHIQKPVTVEDWKRENLLKSIFIRTVH